MRIRGYANEARVILRVLDEMGLDEVTVHSDNNGELFVDTDKIHRGLVILLEAELTNRNLQVL